MKNNHEDYMLISEFSRKVGISHRTIRLYEQMGLVGSPLRSKGGIRHYCMDDIMRFKFVLKLKECGESLEEMHKLAKINDLFDSEGEKSMDMLSESLEIIDIHQRKIKQKITRLESLRADIMKFRNNILVNCIHSRGSGSDDIKNTGRTNDNLERT